MLIPKDLNNCFICERPVDKHGGWVHYHVDYNENPLILWTCDSCNYLERLLRHKIDPTKDKRYTYRNIDERRKRINSLRELRRLDPI